MGRYPGAVTCDLSGQLLPELKPVLALDLTAVEAAGPDTDGILDGTAASTTKATVVTTLPSQPPQTRGLTFTPDAAADTGNIVVVGTNIDDEVITDTIATDAANAVTSALAFKTVTSITFPKEDSSVNWDVGWDERLGLPFILAEKPFYLEMFNNIIEIGTAGALSYDADEIEKNMYDPQGTLNGAKPLRLLLFL